jgi:hypothetical protein
MAERAEKAASPSKVWPEDLGLFTTQYIDIQINSLKGSKGTILGDA